MSTKEISSVVTSAPGKLMLFGDHAVVHDRPCIVTAIDQRIRVRVNSNDEKVFKLNAKDVGLTEYTKPISQLGSGEVPRSAVFLETLYRSFLERHPQQNGLEVETASEFLSTFGFGSSSAVTVAFAKALTELYDIPTTNKDLFDLCYETVLTVQDVGSGFDIASAIWGGTIYYVKPASVVEPLAAESMPLIVGYTGIKADTTTLVKMVAREKNSQPEKIERVFNEIGAITELARQAIQIKDWETVGQLMNKNQEFLEQLNVSSNELDNLITATRAKGAYGAKLSGAGGGDCMVALSSQGTRLRVEQSITQQGGEVMHVKAHADGVRVERSAI